MHCPIGCFFLTKILKPNYITSQSLHRSLLNYFISMEFSLQSHTSQCLPSREIQSARGESLNSQQPPLCSKPTPILFVYSTFKDAKIAFTASPCELATLADTGRCLVLFKATEAPYAETAVSALACRSVTVGPVLLRSSVGFISSSGMGFVLTKQVNKEMGN